MKILASLFLAFIALVAQPHSESVAQTYPNKPIHIVVPFAVAGGADTLTRFVQPALQKALGGVTIIVENKPGAGTVIGTQYVAQAPADGYTLLVTLDQTMTMNPFLYSKLSYDPQKDFVAVSVLAHAPLLYVANPKLPAKTLRELIEYSKSNPDKLNMGSGAISAQVAGAQMMDLTGAKFTFIPYPGGAPALSALLNNEIQFVIADIGTFRAATTDGRLRGLAVTQDKRSPLLPDVPTLKESGYEDLDRPSFWGMWAPAKTPPEIVKTLNEALQQALNDPDVIRNVATMGAQARASSPDELNKMVKTAADVWGPVIKKAGIKAD